MGGFTNVVSALVPRQSQGSARGGGEDGPPPSSLSGLISTLIPLLIINFIFVALFLLFRRKFMRIYEPRTYVGKFYDYQKTPMPTNSLLGWFKDFWNLPDDYVLNHQSIDGYLFLRYFKILIIISFVGACITWPILFPVNATAPASTPPNTQFDLLSFANSATDPNRYYAHVLIAYIFFFFVMFVVGRESLFYIHLRQAWLLSPAFSSRISSRTVLFTDVPEEYRNEARLRSIFPFVKHVWIATETKELEDLVKERDKVAIKLEGAEIGLSKAANAQRLKLQKKNQEFENPIQWVDENKRPTHRLKPLIGQKVDTIDWCRGELQRIIPETEKMQATHWNGQAKSIPAVFIEFENIQGAESAYQQLVFHKPKTLTPRAIGMRPQEVIWSNLDKPWFRRDALYAAATAIVVLMIIFWTPFTIFVGALANIPALAKKVSFLSFILKIPTVILGVVTGLLPTIILAVLMALVPIFLRLLAKFIGGVTVGELEMQVQNWYMAFQVVQVFLITTFATGATAVGSQIASDPTQAPALLATNLPKAANFYISYFVVFGIGTTAGLMLNIVGLAIFIILKNLLMKTPRKRYNQYLSIGGLGWGSTYPKFSCLGIIALSYSMIAPLILGFAAIGFGLLYIAFRYNLFYVLDTNNVSMHGSSYPRALQHLTVGVYLNQICMIGLLAIAIGDQPAATGPMILMIILFVFTILGHIAMRNALKPLIKSLPRDLLSESTRKAGASHQLESGLDNHHNNVGQEQPTTIHDGNGKEARTGTLEPTLSSANRQPGFKGMILRALHPSWLPPFADHLSQTVPEYSNDTRREAYLDPAITSPTPLLWIVHDDMGVSTREKEESGKVIGITDQGAFWEEKKGGLVTGWENQPYEKEDEYIRAAPIHEDPIIY